MRKQVHQNNKKSDKIVE